MQWIILTGEYPPQAGGVSDYTRAVAGGLAARLETVSVFFPDRGAKLSVPATENGVSVAQLPGYFGWRGQLALARRLWSMPAHGTILLQYVPHAFGWKGMNLPLCFWLSRQKRHRLWLMFHEVSYPMVPGQPWRHKLLARVNHAMVRLLVGGAGRVMVSTDSWGPILSRICGRQVDVELAPIPSNFESLSTSLEAAPSATLPGQPPEICVGHFGTFGKATASLLEEIVPALVRAFPSARMVLIGRGSTAFAEKLAQNGVPREALEATGELPPEKLAASFQRCHLFIQPYPDGVTTRRTSTMATLALGCPVVTQAGTLTEDVWKKSGAVRLVGGSNASEWTAAVRELIEAPGERIRLGQRGRALYAAQFSLLHTLDLLQKGPDRPS